MSQDEIKQAAEKLNPQPMRDTADWPQPPFGEITKCGVVPYRVTNQGKLEYYLFKPVPKHQDKGDPGFQIAKGTREIHNTHNGRNEDYVCEKQIQEYGLNNLEPLFATALREGKEEIGLRLKEIIEAGEWGKSEITSAKTGENKPLWLYALRMQPGCLFDAPDGEKAATQERGWFDIQNRDQAEKIRPDHLAILREMDVTLRRQIANGRKIG